MKTTNPQTVVNALERRTIMIGFWLAGLVIAVTAVSYLLHSPFPIRPLVWIIGAAFAAVALLTLEWPRAYRQPSDEVPIGKLRQFLLLAMPLAFVLDSQLCGLGLKACSVTCNVISVAVILLAVAIAIRIHRKQSIGVFLVPLVILGLIPHCVCHAPINVIWHSIFGGYAPTCQVMPLAATLFSLSALRGLRTRYSTALVIVMLVVIAFIAVSNPLFGFPWQGCID